MEWKVGSLVQAYAISQMYFNCNYIQFFEEQNKITLFGLLVTD